MLHPRVFAKSLSLALAPAAGLLLGLGGILNAAASDLVAPGAKLQKISSAFSFTEGPSSDAAGNVYFTDQPNDRIVKWSPDGTFTDWLKPAGRSNGTKFDHHGNLLTCADEKNELWSISPTKEVTVLVKDFGGKALNGPNDVWVRPDGNIYFTDPLYPRDYWTVRGPAMQQPGQYVYYLERKTGHLTPVATDLNQPNGIVGTPDGKTLYVADIGANKTYSYQIQADGSLTEKHLFCKLGSDGMTRDERGNIYLTGHGVTVFDPTGKKIEHIDVNEPWTANITFGGADHKTLFITASKSVYTIQMNVRGAF
jgi:gluconolactonase